MAPERSREGRLENLLCRVRKVPIYLWCWGKAAHEGWGGVWGLLGAVTGWARGASPIYVPMSPPLMLAVFPAGTAPTAGPPGRLSPPCDVQMSPVTLQHLPCASPRGSLANTFIVLIPSCGTCPPRLAPPGHSWHRGRAGTWPGRDEKGVLLLQPPRALWHQLRAHGAHPVPRLAPQAIPTLQWWHQASKGRETRDS